MRCPIARPLNIEKVDGVPVLSYGGVRKAGIFFEYVRHQRKSALVQTFRFVGILPVRSCSVSHIQAVRGVLFAFILLPPWFFERCLQGEVGESSVVQHCSKKNSKRAHNHHSACHKKRLGCCIHNNQALVPGTVSPLRGVMPVSFHLNYATHDSINNM